jgi:Protein of unknown function (DUF3105)
VTRILAVVAGVLVLAGGLVALVAVLGARDDAQVGAATGPGTLEPDHGDRHLGAGQSAQVPAGTLPTSGAHRPDLVTHDARRLSDDQILHAMELGDVVLAYDAASPPPALKRLQDKVTGPFDPELAAAGQAVVLARHAGAGPATALAWRRDLRVSDPADPRLEDFAEAWLGRGVKPSP